MTKKRSLFVEGILKGLSPEEAHLHAGYASTDTDKAMRLLEEPEIMAALVAREDEIWNRTRALAVLRRIMEAAVVDATTEDFNAQSANAALRAIDLGNRMCGCNEPNEDVSGKEIKFVMEEADEYAV